MKKEAITFEEEEVFENYSYSINTATIFWNEYQFKREPESFEWKTCPFGIGKDLENIIQSLLVNHAEPRVDYSPKRRKFLIEKYNTFSNDFFAREPFLLDFFVPAYNKPKNKNGNNHLTFGGDRYYYLYSYAQAVIVSRKTVMDYQFELLFAFALRQCDLMHIDSFLNFHFESNFAGTAKKYCQYLKQITRKFASKLLTTELSDSIKEWIVENENSEKESGVEKIKTYLTVKQLAFIFRALKEIKLIEGKTEKSIAKVISKAFDSKAQEDLSPESVYNHYYALDYGAIEFWLIQFPKLEKFTKKLKEKK
ncbi:MAG: hypothetical protein IPO83_05080 [Chitinophagaceae bacterium]|nr:hypothetical protein [Chitinophagaceae bacterium]